MKAIAALETFPAIAPAIARTIVNAPDGHVAHLATPCCNCSLRELCLPCGPREAGLPHTDEPELSRRRIKSGGHFFRAGDKLTSLYALRSGSARHSMMLMDGRDQVIGFFMAGDVMGLDGIQTGQHACEATALEDSEVCMIPFARLERMSLVIAAVQQHLHRLMGREITREQGHLLLLGSMRAEQRLANFLLDLSRRYAARGYSATLFNLRMTREDIGSYLGLKIETISRMLSRFQKRDLITVRSRQIEIIDLDALQRVTRDHEKGESESTV
jgi:CRP/FNR family transcriptional regulator, anaerobic regulatory protein